MRRRLRFGRWVLALFLAASVAGCRRVPPAVPVSQASLYLEEGDRQFEAGNYPEAALAYEAFLQQPFPEEQGPGVRLRLAMSELLSPAPLENVARARELLEGLRGSPGVYSGQAALILQFLNQVEALRTDLAQREQRIRRLREELEAIKAIDMKRTLPRPLQP